MSHKYTFSREEVSYYIGSISVGDSLLANRSKLILQRLCKEIEAGRRFEQSDNNKIELTVNGLLTTCGDYYKVKRWCLNLLSLIGTYNSLPNIRNVITDKNNPEDVKYSALAALLRLVGPNSDKVFIKKHFPEESILLSSLMVHHNKKINYGKQVDINNASLDVLKQSLVLVGKNLAPNNLFHPHHSNSEFIRELSKHDDEIVSQYAIWAVSNNKNLKISDIGTNINDCEKFPPNVRGYIYRAIGRNESDIVKYRDLFENATYDLDNNVRCSAATGIIKTYYDGIESITLDWLNRENSCVDTRMAIIDHMIINSNDRPFYSSRIIQEFQENSTTKQKDRMLANATGLRIYAKMKRINLQSENYDLFEGGVLVSININNLTNNGNMSLTGSAINNGAISTTSNDEKFNEIVLEIINQLKSIEDETKIDGKDELIEAAEKIIKDKNIKKDSFLDKASKFVDTAEASFNLGEKVKPIIEFIGKNLPILSQIVASNIG